MFFFGTKLGCLYCKSWRVIQCNDRAGKRQDNFERSTEAFWRKLADPARHPEYAKTGGARVAVTHGEYRGTWVHPDTVTVVAQYCSLDVCLAVGRAIRALAEGVYPGMLPLIMPNRIRTLLCLESETLCWQ
jgi:hypothetical protein